MLSINKKIILISLGVFVLALFVMAFAICRPGINAFADELNGGQANVTYSGEKKRVDKDGFIATYGKTATVDVEYYLGEHVNFDLYLYNPAGEEDAFWPWDNDKYQKHHISLSFDKYEVCYSYAYYEYYLLKMSDSCSDFDAGVSGTIYGEDRGEPSHFDIDTNEFRIKSEDFYEIPKIDYIVFEANE